MPLEHPLLACQAASIFSSAASCPTSRFTRLERPKAIGLSRPRTSRRMWIAPLSVFSRRMRSPVTRRYCSIPAFSEPTRVSGGQGLVRKRKIQPRFTASMAASRFAWPVIRMRTVLGATSRTRARNRIPSIRGMCMSDTTTA
jgi:hypothetical protein